MLAVLIFNLKHELDTRLKKNNMVDNKSRQQFFLVCSLLKVTLTLISQNKLRIIRFIWESLGCYGSCDRLQCMKWT